MNPSATRAGESGPDITVTAEVDGRRCALNAESTTAGFTAAVTVEPTQPPKAVGRAPAPAGCYRIACEITCTADDPVDA